MARRKSNKNGNNILIFCSVFSIIYVIYCIDTKQDLKTTIIAIFISLFLIVIYLYSLGLYLPIRQLQLKRKYKSYNTNKKVSKGIEKNYEVNLSKNIEVGKTLNVSRKDDSNVKLVSTTKIQYKLPPLTLINKEENKKFISALKKLDSKNYEFILGTYSNGKVKIQNIDTMPNLLIGGTIMTGKTTFIRTMLATLLLNKSPNELKLLILDSKSIEYSDFNGLPHLLAPIITNSRYAYIALKHISTEIERRYDILEESKTKNIDEYNLTSEEKISKILIIIDEYMSFNMNSELNSILESISQDAWRVGINIVLVVNHPSSSVISSLAKSNFLTRISFRTTSMQDSRLILGQNGAEKIIGQGNFLFLPRDTNNLTNVKEFYLSDDVIKKIVDYYCSQHRFQYDETILMDDEEKWDTTMVEKEDDYEEPLYNEIVEFVIEQGEVSTSLLQRRFRLGYNRAARCIDLLEERGIIGPQNDLKPREVLVKFKND